MSRIPLTATLFVLTLAVLPAVDACHLGLGVRQAHGLVVVEGAPTPAAIRFERCEGPVQVTVTLELTGATHTFVAAMDIPAPGVRCLTEPGCSPVFPPAAAFELRSVAQGLLLAGVFENAGHFALSTQLAGTYQGQPAAFASAVA